MAGALAGTRVIDLGQYIAGPLAGMLLADQGADVIRVDPPGGPRWAHPGNATWNRGKRAIALDLARPEDLRTAQQLAASADVWIENFRPGVMQRFGLGAEQICRANPRLVHCSLPGFAADDPRAGLPAWEGIVGAASATYRPAPGAQDAAPVYTAIPIASTYAAIQAAVSIAMALIERDRSGLGQRIEVPLFDAMFAAIGTHGLHRHRAAAPAAAAGAAWSGEFQCKDGRWVRFGGAGNQNFREFVQHAGIESWDAEGLTDFARLRADPELRRRAAQAARELFLTRTAQEWEDLVAAAGSECAVCRSSEEWLRHPHARQSQMVIEVADPELGAALQPGIAVRMSETAGQVRGPAPKPDAQRAEILRELAPAPQLAHTADAVGAANRAADAAGPLAALRGIRVLDLCIILAGPTLGRTLAEFGADVIKIDSPRRGAERGIAFHNDINRGKRSLLLDLKSEAGREIFWKLLERADVVAENYRADKLAKLGLDYESVRRRKPGIVYASLNAYGPLGPWRTRPGHEQFAQATTGMSLRFGGDGRPLLQPYAVNDYGTGYLGAFGVALALLHRQRTGRGQLVNAALAYTAMTLQSAYLHGHATGVWSEPRGPHARGSAPLQRAYATADGWIFLGARRSALAGIARAEGLAAVAGLEGPALERALEQGLARDTSATWSERLRGLDVGVHPVISRVSEVMRDPWVVAHGLSATREHDELGPITTCGPAPRLSRTPLQIGRPAPRPGSDARSVLAEIGEEGRLEELVARGVVRIDGVGAG